MEKEKLYIHLLISYKWIPSLISYRRKEKGAALRQIKKKIRMTKKTTTTIIVLDEQLYKYVGVMRTIRRRNKEIKKKKKI